MFPNASIIHALALVYDHLPLILNTDGLGQLCSRPFKFETMWIREPRSFFTIARALEPIVERTLALLLFKKLDLVKKASWKWNKLHFGFIKDRIRMFTCELDRVQKLDSFIANVALESSLHGVIQE